MGNPSKSPWCRGKEGQEHDWRLWAYDRPPYCQPLRDWARERIEDSRVKLLTDDQQLAEEWECFHHETCVRCRKNSGRTIFRDECPTHQSGGPFICDPPMSQEG